MRFRRAYCILGTLMALLIATSLSATVGSAQKLISTGNFGEALASLEGLESQDAESLFLRGVVLAELSRDAEAESMFRDLIESYPDYPEPYNNLAVLLAGSGRFEEAVETLKGALRTHPSYRTAWDNLTTIYGRLASEAYSRALNVESSAQTAPVKLALLGTLSGATEPGMGPVETISAVAVAPLPKAPSVADAAPAEPLAGISDASMADETVTMADEESSVQVAEVMVPDGTVMLADEEMQSEVPEKAVPDEPLMQADEQILGEEEREEVAAVPVEESEVLEPVEPVRQEEPEVSEAAPSPADLTALVEAWAAAWSAQKADDYLSFYSPAFTPSDGTELADWQELRRSRLAAPEFIRVSVALLDYEVDGDQAKVVFNQSYESNTFSDLVTKTLALTREDGAWKIVQETVGP